MSNPRMNQGDRIGNITHAGFCFVQENLSQEDLSELEAVDAWIADMVSADVQIC